MLRVLVADDSALAREALTRLIDDDPEMMVVGVASGGEETVRQAAELRPDLITLDLLMPDIDGVETTRRIMASSPAPIVLVSSTVTAAFASTHFDALSAGAVDVVGKPDFQRLAADPELRRAFLANLKAMSTVVTVTRRTPAPRALRRDAPSERPELPARVALIAIGASTGGPGALAKTLAGVGVGCPPIVIVQHMARGFIEGFAEWLAGRIAPRVVLASSGARPSEGTVYVAPDDRHLELDAGGCLGLREGPPVRHQRPSVDVLFESVAAHLGEHAVGVLLTGMGDDGARGLLSMRRSGALTLAQDRDSAVVYGMPAAAAERGAVGFSARCEKLAELLAELEPRSPGSERAP